MLLSTNPTRQMDAKSGGLSSNKSMMQEGLGKLDEKPDHGILKTDSSQSFREGMNSINDAGKQAQDSMKGMARMGEGAIQNQPRDIKSMNDHARGKGFAGKDET